MTIRVGINGFGRIGRNFYRAIIASGRRHRDRRCERPHGQQDARAPAQVRHRAGPVPAERRLRRREHHRRRQEDPCARGARPREPPWAELGADIVIESTGFFTDATKAKAHIDAGAKKVIISAPAKNEDGTFVVGVNHTDYDPRRSTSSRTRRAPRTAWPRVAKALNDSIGIERGLMTTIHAYTGDQNLQDGPHKDLRRARAAAQNIVPTSTGAAKAVALVLPELKGKLDGFALRVPIDHRLGHGPDVHGLARGHGRGGQRRGQGRRRGPAQGHPRVRRGRDRLRATSSPTRTRASSTPKLTKVSGDLVKIIAWYDNEWGYSNSLVALTAYVGERL